MRTTLPYLLSVIALCLLLTSCKETVNNTQDSTAPFTIGFIGPLSGDAANWGNDILGGCRFALKQQQKEGRFKFVELVTADDSNNPELAKAVFRKMVEEKKVSAVLAASDSQAVLGLRQVADAYGIPVLSLTATHPQITESSHISQLLFDDTTQATVAALYAIDEMLIDSVAVLKDSTNPHSEMLASTFVKKFNQAGGMVEVIDLARKANEIEERLQFFKDDHIAFLYLPLSADQVIQTVTTLRKIHYRPEMMVSDGLLSVIYDRYRQNMDDVNGMYAIDVGSADLEFSPKGKELYKEFSREENKKGTTFTLAGAEGMLIMLNTLHRCSGDEKPECINAMLRSTHDFPGMYGKLSINKRGKAERAIYVNQIKNGSMHVVVKVH